MAMFEPFQIDSCGCALQRPLFRQKNAADHLPLSLVDLRRRRPKCGTTISPAQFVVWGTLSGNWYQTAWNDHINLLISQMEYGHSVDIAEQLTRPRILRVFTMNAAVPLCHCELVAWNSQQYDLSTYLRGVNSCLASTMSTQGDNSLSRFALIDSPLDKWYCMDFLTFTEIEGGLMVRFFTINMMVIVDDIEQEI